MDDLLPQHGFKSLALVFRKRGRHLVDIALQEAQGTEVVLASGRFDNRADLRTLREVFGALDKMDGEDQAVPEGGNVGLVLGRELTLRHQSLFLCC